MSITFRHYAGLDDFEAVGDFLVSRFNPGNQDGNWLQPTWEYIYSHTNLNRASLG